MNDGSLLKDETIIQERHIVFIIYDKIWIYEFVRILWYTNNITNCLTWLAAYFAFTVVSTFFLRIYLNIRSSHEVMKLNDTEEKTNVRSSFWLSGNLWFSKVTKTGRREQ